MARLAMEAPRILREIRGMGKEPIRLRQAIELLMREVDGILAEVRPFARNAADHLERSCESLMFNANEGIASIRPKVKINAYDIARKEAAEVRAVLRRFQLKGLVTSARIRRALNLAAVCMSMLGSAMKTLSAPDRK